MLMQAALIGLIIMDYFFKKRTLKVGTTHVVGFQEYRRRSWG